MPVPIIVALTSEYVTEVFVRLATLPGVLLGVDEVRAALEAAAVATDQSASQSELF